MRFADEGTKSELVERWTLYDTLVPPQFARAGDHCTFSLQTPLLLVVTLRTPAKTGGSAQVPVAEIDSQDDCADGHVAHPDSDAETR